MRFRALGRATALVAALGLMWGAGTGSASADQVRDGQWPLIKYNVVQDVWPISKGQGVIVGLIDSGVSAGQQDLTGQILPGADFSGGHSDGRTDENGHGTEMAGLIAGHGHGVGGQDGIMGLAPGVKILPVKVHLAADRMDLSGDVRLADAIRYAVDHGAKVINMSLRTSGGHDSGEREAVRYAVDHDVVLVGATGNDGFDRVAYPAAFPGVIAVGAVDVDGKVWDKSNHGPETTLSAPGVHIPHAEAGSTGGYNLGSGTSDATAYVSATAALVRAKYPELSAGQVINRLIKSAVAPPDGSKAPNDRYGYGIASPRQALSADIPAGAKENPLLGRAEAQQDDGQPSTSAVPSQPAAAAAGGTRSAVPGGSGDAAAPQAADGGGVPVWAIMAGAVVVLLLVVVVLLVVRRRRGGGGGPGGLSGPGAGYPPYAPPPQQQPYPGQWQQQPYGQGYPQPPQQPNPYQQPGQQPGQQPNPYQQ
ncbi:S8 family serine peptidase [Streptomyces sp. NPDC092296]|uniref:S8 family serine peptidase n=1 Tax=Streptomyces sp. NPDC092296 TaxID=3366012 RepID=UPI003826CBFB